MTSRPRYARRRRGLAVLLVAAALSGCQVASTTKPVSYAAEPIDYLTVDELGAVLAGGSDTLLVEFCVPHGCARCAQMRGPIDRLASEQREGLTFRRVNLSQAPQLYWEFNLTACPSYVAFRDGKEVFRAAHPTSAGLIEAGIEESLRTPSAEPIKLAAQ